MGKHMRGNVSWVCTSHPGDKDRQSQCLFLWSKGFKDAQGIWTTEDDGMSLAGS